MRDQLRAGAALYNAGYYHAAHNAWEDHWLDLEADTDDERLLHGLIQSTAAVFHACERNWDGAVGVADSALEYLAVLPPTYRDVSLPAIRAFLSELATDPECLERRPPVRLTHDDEVPTLSTLEFGPTAIVAPILANELGFDQEPIEQARRYAEQDLEAGNDGSRFITLLFDFVRDETHREIIYQRLCNHASRRQAREEDVEGLF
ncbi:DUF309 domain-containing protein [Natronorubrum sulfidifaciens]|uniref:DUF309 domain-containing protein n=1 Tax=Natronorubrum sulfidifaciens JCM 14089 TaxID=1230460 RepID=L9WF10_9EURY|nr:DUF309 domain-containing protein [Natronorubrum sulfidifaciens]ELY46903.1 hypothetical protein C495_05563 [Natronorubrum sulfidifaciens JCM 14089]